METKAASCASALTMAAVSGAVGLLVLSSVSWAAGPLPAPPFMNSNLYQECGQPCLYQKANENLSLQALYTVEKIQRVSDPIQDSGSSDADKVSAVSEIQQYCYDYFAPGAPISAGDIDFDKNSKRCLFRYVSVQAPLLRKIRSAIVLNDDHVAAFRSKAAAVQAGGANGNPARKPQTPYLPTLNELEAQQSQLQRLSGAAYQKWIVEAMPKPPDCAAEFPQTQPILRDPTNPGSGTILVLVRDPKGNPVPDPKLCKAALQDYNDQKKAITNDLVAYIGEIPKRQSADPRIPIYDPRAVKIKDDKISTDSYGSARYQMIGVTDTLLRRDGVAGRNTLVFPGKTPDSKKVQKGGSTTTDQAPPEASEADILKAENAPVLEGEATSKSSESQYTVKLDPKALDGALDSVYLMLARLKNNPNLDLDPGSAALATIPGNLPGANPATPQGFGPKPASASPPGAGTLPASPPLNSPGRSMGPSNPQTPGTAP